MKHICSCYLFICKKYIMQAVIKYIANFFNIGKDDIETDCIKKVHQCEYISIGDVTIDLFNKVMFNDNRIIFGKYYIKVIEGFDTSKVGIYDLFTEKILKVIYETKNNICIELVTDCKHDYYNQEAIPYNQCVEIYNSGNVCLIIREHTKTGEEIIFTIFNITKINSIRQVCIEKIKYLDYTHHICTLINNLLYIQFTLQYSSLTLIININTPTDVLKELQCKTLINSNSCGSYHPILQH